MLATTSMYISAGITCTDYVTCISHLLVLRFHCWVGTVGGGVAVPLERDRPLPGLGAALDLLHLRPEVDVLSKVELVREAMRGGSGKGAATRGTVKQGKARHGNARQRRGHYATAMDNGRKDIGCHTRHRRHRDLVFLPLTIPPCICLRLP